MNENTEVLEGLPVWLSQFGAVLLLHPASRGVARAFWPSPQAFLHEPANDTIPRNNRETGT